MKKILSLLFIMLLAPKAVTAQEIYSVLSSDQKTLTFYYDTKKDSRSGTVYDFEWTLFDNYVYLEWYACHETITTVVFDESMKTARPKSLNSFFENFNKLEKIENLTYLDTRNVEDMSYLFHCCYSLTSLDLSNFDTGNVKNMRSMFCYCYSLTSLDVSGFDTRKVEDMDYMFYYCSNLTSLDVSNFDTRKVEDMSCMFSLCTDLTTLDLSNFDTGNVLSMYSMFALCENLTTIYCAKNWSKSAVLSEEMFKSCYDLVGGKGTAYNENYIDAAYARPDDGPEAPGYFTKPTNNGDVNNDGFVDVADISTIIDIMAGKMTSSKGDVNVDGFIDVADISMVVDIMAGKIVFLNAPAGAMGIDLGLPSGTLWANMNVGATAEHENGLYFAWGETKGYKPEDGHQFVWANYKWMTPGKTEEKYLTKYNLVDGHAELLPSDDAAHVIWGGDWCTPTTDHIKELIDNTTLTEEKLNGVAVGKFTSKINGDSIYIPAAGIYSDKGIVENAGKTGDYWSSTRHENYPSMVGDLWFYLPSVSKYATNNSRYIGLPVRPVIKGSKPFAQ